MKKYNYISEQSLIEFGIIFSILLTALIIVTELRIVTESYTILQNATKEEITLHIETVQESKGVVLANKTAPLQVDISDISMNSE